MGFNDPDRRAKGGYRPSGVVLRTVRKVGERGRLAVQRELILRLKRDGLDRDQIAKIAGVSVATVGQIFKFADTYSAMEIETLKALIAKRGVTSVQAKIAELCEPKKRNGSRIKFDAEAEAGESSRV
jgi:hypothetical protein